MPLIHSQVCMEFRAVVFVLQCSGIESLPLPCLASRAKGWFSDRRDVYEMGQTLRAIRKQVDSTFVVWMSKSSPEGWNAATTTSADEWLVFPWENVDRASEDEGRYRSSRSILP